MEHDIRPVINSDQIIDAETARIIHKEALQKWPLLAWVIIRDEADFPGKVLAQLITAVPTTYALVADTLAELRDQLPPNPELSKRQPSDPPEIFETWFAK
jgi:hypothetical protein